MRAVDGLQQKMNFRLFCFLPTKSCLPLWESGYRHQETGVWTFYPDSVIVNREDLRDVTNPLSADFDLATYNVHAFCSHTGLYCAFCDAKTRMKRQLKTSNETTHKNQPNERARETSNKPTVGITEPNVCDKVDTDGSKTL